MFRTRRRNDELPTDICARNKEDSRDLNFTIASTYLTLDVLIKNVFPDSNERTDLVDDSYSLAIAQSKKCKYIYCQSIIFHWIFIIVSIASPTIKRKVRFIIYHLN